MLEDSSRFSIPFSHACMTSNSLFISSLSYLISLISGFSFMLARLHSFSWCTLHSTGSPSRAAAHTFHAALTGAARRLRARRCLPTTCRAPAPPDLDGTWWTILSLHAFICCQLTQLTPPPLSYVRPPPVSFLPSLWVCRTFGTLLDCLLQTTPLETPCLGFLNMHLWQI